MKEIEKRLGLQAHEAANLKGRLIDEYALPKIVRRTLLIKTGEGFAPDPETLIDIKIKLIDDETILAVKHGVWHGDSVRQEYETRFERADLTNLIASLLALTYDTFILLSTRRSMWEVDGLIVTLDEYTNADGKALFEVEVVDESKDEVDIDQFFAKLGISPMNSAATIAFIGEVNKSDDIQIDLSVRTPEAISALMLRSHA